MDGEGKILRIGRAAAPLLRRGDRRGPARFDGLPLDRAPDAPPLYAQIRDRVRSAVLTGALAPGMRLPPERELAATLGVNRTTTMRAYQELAADGVVEARPGRGTLVCIPEGGSGAPGSDGLFAAGSTGERGNEADVWPARGPSAAWLLGLHPLGQNLGPDPSLLRDALSLAARDGVISFAAGAPLGEALAFEAVRDALAAAMDLGGATALAYGPVEGLTSLRRAIAARMARRGAAAATSEVLVLSGATQGLALAARALLEPGDEVVVEAPTYVGLLQTFGAAGLRLIGVPLDGEGIRLDLLAPILARRRVRLIVVQPTLHNPTGISMSQGRRERLVALARRHGVPILEDLTYAELCAEGAEPPPLLALDKDGLVLHLGSFAKTIAPGLRVGWLVGPAPAIARLALAKQCADLNTGALAQLAVGHMLESGAYDCHLTRVRALYAARRGVLAAALRNAGGCLEVPADPAGGFYLWCRVPGGRGRHLAAEAIKSGVALLFGEAFYPASAMGGEDGTDRIRLSVAGVGPEVITEGIGRLLPILERQHRVRRGAGAQDDGLRPVI